MPDSQPIPLYLFAKAPEPGLVKTRMQPVLTAEACAALATMMLEDAATRVANAWPGPKVLCVAPDTEHPVLQRVAGAGGFRLLRQVDTDLGGRMIAALEDGIGDSGRAVVMGCDVPYLEPRILTHAWQCMQDGSNVVGPAEDGGFYLLGVDRAPKAAFANVAWGGSQVLDQVVQQANADGMSFEQLDRLRDIDRPDDLEWLAHRDERYAALLPVDKRNAVYG